MEFKIRKRPVHVGKTEVAFTVAVGILLAAAVSSIVFDHQSDPGLVTAVTGLIGAIIVRRSERTSPEDDQ